MKNHIADAPLKSDIPSRGIKKVSFPENGEQECRSQGLLGDRAQPTGTVLNLVNYLSNQPFIRQFYFTLLQTSCQTILNTTNKFIIETP